VRKFITKGSDTLTMQTYTVEYIPEPKAGRMLSTRPDGPTEWRVLEGAIQIGRYNTKERAKEVARAQAREGDKIKMKHKSGGVDTTTVS